MTRYLGLGLLFAIFFTPGLQADEVELFQKFNPDGAKYEFVNNYIKSLSYIRKNAQRYERLVNFEFQSMDTAEKTKALINELLIDNVNYRAARNLLKRFHTPANGLILQATDIFMKVCDEQIDYNNQERDLLEKWYEAQTTQQLQGFDKQAFMDRQNQLAASRKESLKNMIKSSVLVNKILLSDQADPSGEFKKLGITEKQRRALLESLYEFYGDGYQGKLRSGQTFLEGSISTIRVFLEDENWQTSG